VSLILSHIVVNAGNKYTDLEHMKKIKETEFAGKDITIDYLQDKALIALQGPKAHLALAPLVSVDLSKVYFNNHLIVKSPKIDSTIQIVRSGYTGEDGFEISVPADKAEAFSDLLLQNDYVKPTGLGARDTLRLEAGLCLHGLLLGFLITY
jgi:Glycine cleavage system T protein (aminomethyltransferase)